MARHTQQAQCGASARNQAGVWPRATGVRPALHCCGIGGRGARRAFTLAELIVTLVVIVVAAGLIAPRMQGSLDKRAIREAVAEFAATARTVRELAIANGRTMSIQLDLDHRAYVVAAREAKGHTKELSAVRLSWLKAGRWPEAVRQVALRTPDGNTLQGGTQRVDFRPDGTTSGGALRLMGTNESEVWQVAISPRTGRVTVGDGRTQPPVEQFELGD